MTFYIEKEAEIEISIPVEEIVEAVLKETLQSERCPYEAQVTVLLTDNGQIREYNKKYREIDAVTDVLSFPNVEYERAGDFSLIKAHDADCFDPETGELFLGDVVISLEKVKEQAHAYGHSERREFAFLIAHSMLHLCGYDHMEKEEAGLMEKKQEQILTALGIGRD